MDMREKIQKILHIAVPATVENVLQALVGFVDTLMVAHIGLLAVTAVGVAGNLFAVYLAVFIALGVGTSSLIARHLGGKRLEDARRIAAQSIVLAVLSGLAFGAVTLAFGGRLLGLMGASTAVMTSASAFFMIIGGTSVLASLITVIGSILRATGDAKSPMVINTGVNLMNIALGYVLIFGIGPFAGLGIVGSAIGTTLSRLIGCGLLFRKLQKTDMKLTLRELLAVSNYKELLLLSTPAVMERLVMRLGQVVYFGLIVALGVKTYAAHSIAGNIESFTYMPGYGLATATSVLVGNRLGAGDRKQAYEYGVISAKAGACIMAVGGVVLFFGAPWFASWFTQDGAAVGKIVTALRIDAFIQIPLAISLVLAGALQGAGDTKSPLYSTAVGMWAIRVVGVYVLGVMMHLDIAGVWLAILIDITVRAVFLTFRFRHHLNSTQTDRAIA